MAPAPPASTSTSARQLLVVDDEADMLDFIERVFRREYRVWRAQSVDEALPLLERERFVVLITDRRMPRRSGFELLERARAMQPEAARILLSGYTDHDADVPADADACVTKPVDSETLRQVVADVVARRGAAGRG